MDKELFLDPPKEYRPAPFWSWNDDLQNEELVWQVEQMKTQGFGGYFMHSRVGLITEYLSEEWMDRIRTCLEAGKRIGMESWLYDEDKWPSGFAGGIVPAMGDDYTGRALTIQKIKPADIDRAKGNDGTIGIFSVELDDNGRAKSWQTIHPGRGRQADRRGELFVVSAATAQASNWFNGEAYVDLLNPKVAEAFIQCTHEHYRRHFGRDFGEFMPGIFTDEPNYRCNIFGGSGVVPWTDEFPAYFKQRWGYDIVKKLPLLFFDGKGCHKVRYDFWRAITTRFLESFSKPLFDWCEQHGSMLTGHYLMEDTLLSQIEVIGAAMPHYEYMQLPGIDHLGRNISDPLTLKQVSSAAHQFGRNRVLCEIFGVSGHSMSFEDMKWIADFHFALGITFMNQHLTLYSMTGERKRDFPPTISYHQPYWQYYRAVNDYFARCAYMLTRGDFCADLLVLHPIGSAWASMVTPLPGTGRYQINAEVMRYNDELVRLQDHLLSNHYDFDYGDEMIMATHASVEDGKLVVGGMRYSVVVIPPSLTWSQTTFELLEKFVGSGGHIVAVGQLPTMIDAEASGKWQRLLRHAHVVRCENNRQEMEKALGGIVPRDVSITEENGDEVADICYHHRVCGTRHIYFMSSKNRDTSFETTVSVRGTGGVSEWRPADGGIEPVGATAKDGRTAFNATFHPTGSHIFVLDTGSRPETARRTLRKETVTERFAGPWRFKRTHLNSLTLDYCRLSTQGSPYNDWMPVWKARHEVARVFGLAKYGGIQPWVLIKKGVKIEEEDRRVNLQFRFAVEELPRSAFVVVEKAEKFRISVNGAEVSTAAADWYWDKQFKKLTITDRLAVGENIVELACDYTMDTEIEDIYVVGDFGVRSYDDTRFAVVGEPEKLDAGSWTVQRYPFYAGNMVYYQDVELREKEDDRVLVRLVEPKGCAFKVSVNGKEGGLISWHPWEIDVTFLVKDGTNEIAVEVVGTLRNTMGPLHHKDGDLYAVGPGHFTDQENWTDVYQFVPYGILGELQVVRVQRRDI